MPYVVRRTLKVGGEPRHPGEAIPEAESWRRLGDWISAGYVAEVDEEQLAKEQAQRREKAEAEQPEPPPEPPPEPEPKEESEQRKTRSRKKKS